MWPRFDSRTRRRMWVGFVVGSLLCSGRFFSGYSGFPLSSKINISKFQFDLECKGKQITFTFFFTGLTFQNWKTQCTGSNARVLPMRILSSSPPLATSTQGRVTWESARTNTARECFFSVRDPRRSGKLQMSPCTKHNPYIPKHGKFKSSVQYLISSKLIHKISETS